MSLLKQMPIIEEFQDEGYTFITLKILSSDYKEYVRDKCVFIENRG